MHSRDDRGTRPFGRRRLPDAAAARGFPVWKAGRAAGLLAWALRVSGVVGLLAVIAATQLARLGDPGGATDRVALGPRPGPADPETTGAIPVAGSARATLLNPCLAAAARPRLRP